MTILRGINTFSPESRAPDFAETESNQKHRYVNRIRPVQKLNGRRVEVSSED